MRQQNLDRHVAAEAIIPRTPDFAHAAGAEQACDCVDAEPIAWSKVPAIAGDALRHLCQRRRRQKIA